MLDFIKVTEKTEEKIAKLAEASKQSTIIDPKYYEVHDVKRGLRDENGKGVVAGLTEISEILSSKVDENGVSQPMDGELYYRGTSINDIVEGFVKENRFGFEEVTYLLLFGKMPTSTELGEFNDILGEFRSLPLNFVRDVIMKRPSIDMMNVLQRSVLTLYAYDDNADDVSIPNVLTQCLKLISSMPLLSVYAYQVYMHYHDDGSLIIHKPDPKMSTAENILRLLRPDSKFSALEARLLDMCLVLHAEHGGGNNSTFTTHVVSSSLTDTYSVIAASLGSLKGPRHGGANIKVMKMMDDMKANLKSYSDEDVYDYLMKLLNKEAFDKSGLIYGMGHAVYSASDPRANILKSFVKILAEEKGMQEEYNLYKKIEELAPKAIAEKRKIFKGVSANIDFYSGFVYHMLGLPPELYTPIFAISRMPGWAAHRIEELSNNGKIIRPAYVAVADRQEYVPLSERK
ncbi:MAG: citrate/2-methylcitrate synthase [Bacillota bacterium]